MSRITHREQFNVCNLFGYLIEVKLDASAQQIAPRLILRQRHFAR